MQQRYSGIFSICATCVHWTGARVPDPLGRLVIVPSSQTQGRCSGGGFNQLNVLASASCATYMKWGALR